MRRKHTPVVLFVACLFWSGFRVADRTLASGAEARLVERLRSDSPTERSADFTSLESERQATIFALIDLVDSSEQDTKSQDLKHRAIELLGKYRAVEARSVLIRQIEFYPPHLLISDHPLYRYPAAVALDRIGEPAIRQILTARMHRAATDRELKIFAYLVWCHYVPQGEEEVGLFRMERLLERAEAEREKYAKARGLKLGPSVRQKNLSRLIKLYETIRPNDPADWPRPARSKPKKPEIGNPKSGRNPGTPN